MPLRGRLLRVILKRLSENPHLPFDRPFDRLTVLSKVEGLTALSKAEGLRYPYPSSLRRTQKVKGKRWKPLGRELGAERAEGKKLSEIFCLCLKP